ncbi:ABC transporter ATP-binding protein [Thiohalorhabdus sp.]|uniref:ABC transporter ATP-binding protein n=1 Tax=Thiohalorhabdus sp. TaxID=3094134 RepID=UPI002FC2E059
MTSEPATMIQVEDLGTRMGDRWIHRHLNLTAYTGELLGVVGASGSGKSLLLHQILGMLPAPEGRVRVRGVDIHRATPDEYQRLRKEWGILFQTGALFSAFTVFDNVAFPLREMARFGEALEEDLIRELTWLRLESVQLEPEDARKRPQELSEGMVKRAALARALILDPALILLDEPTAGLDPALAREFLDLLTELRQEMALTGLVISHDRDALATLSDRLAVLAEGRIVTVGSLEEVARSEHPFVRGLFEPSRGQKRLSRLIRSAE